MADTRPPFDDIFEEWNLGKTPPVGDIVDEPAWCEPSTFSRICSLAHLQAPNKASLDACSSCPIAKLDGLDDCSVARWEKYDLPMLPKDGTQRGGGGCPAVRLDQIADYEGEGVWRVRHRGEEWLEQQGETEAVLERAAGK